MLVMHIPKYWIFGKDTNTDDGEYGLPLDYNPLRWRKAMSCLNCNRDKICKCVQRRRKYLRKTPARFVSLLFSLRFFQCGKTWHGACEKFFKKDFFRRPTEV